MNSFNKIGKWNKKTCASGEKKRSCQYLQSLRKGSVSRAMSLKPLLYNDIISKGILGNGTATTTS
jgi:hypothetical protein